MTKKRFKEQNLENHLNRIYDTTKGEVVFDEDIVDLLNTLHDENEQLKQTISDWKGSYDGLYEDVKRLEKENGNFKKALRIVYSTKLTEPTKHTIEQIAKHCRVDLE